jgi:cytochrome bd-type quinol oxidase subunit 2
MIKTLTEKLIKQVHATDGLGGAPGPNAVIPNEISNPLISDKIKDMAGSDYVALIVKNLLTLFLIVTGVVALFMLVIGGIRWILSAGDKAQLEGARSQVTQALIGLVIVFSAFAIIKLIGSFFGIELLTFDLNPLFLK